MKNERQDEIQFTTKIGGKTSLGPSYFVLQNFIPTEAFDGLLRQNWPFSPPNSLTLRITLLNDGFFGKTRKTEEQCKVQKDKLEIMPDKSH